MLRRLLIFLILFAGVSIAGGVYKWVDERGITVFSETPPSGKTVQQVKLPPQPPKSIALPAGAEGGQGSEDNRRNYVTAMIEGAKQGNADAQFYLGFMLEKGIGFSTDEAEAVKWYRKAAEQENARSQSNAQSMLGLMYADGRGVAKDNTEAMRWFGKVMKKRYADILSESDPVIMIDLRMLKDKTKVMNRYRKEAESGSARAQSILGDMYAKGFGINKDEVEAFKWYSKAADQGGFGGRGAPYNLGFMYAEGRGVAKDEEVAIKWYRKAAEQEAVGLETIIRMSYEYGPF